MLHYEIEFQEEDADFELCMPIRNGSSTAELDLRRLPSGRCMSLVQKGPYDGLGQSCSRLFEYLKEHNYQTVVPSRAVYLKGPGMIF